MTPSAVARRIAMRPDLSLAVLLIAYGLYRAAQVLPGRLPHPTVFAVLIGTGAYLAFGARFASRAAMPPAATRTVFAASDVAYAVSLAVALLIWRQSLYVVPPHYFLALTVAAGSILFDAIYGRTEIDGAFRILAKVVVLGVLLRAMAYYQFPGPIGSDPWRHVLTIATTASTGHVIDQLPNALETHNGYSSIPVFHILAAISGNVGGISAKAAAFVAASVPQVLSVLSIFLLGKVVHGERAGILAALLYCVADYSILWGVQVIAMTLATAIAACLLWLLLSGRAVSAAGVSTALLLVVALILCHTVSAFVILVAMVSVTSFSRLRKMVRFAWTEEFPVPTVGLPIVALYGVLMLVWWMTMPTSTGDSFFAVQASKLADVMATAAEVQAPSTPVGASRPYAHLLHDSVGSALLIGLGLCAALASFTRGRRQGHLLSSAVAAGALVSFQAVGSGSLQKPSLAHVGVFQYMSGLFCRPGCYASLVAMAWLFLRSGADDRPCLVYAFPMMTNSISNQANRSAHQHAANRLHAVGADSVANDGRYDGGMAAE